MHRSFCRQTPEGKTRRSVFSSVLPSVLPSVFLAVWLPRMVALLCVALLLSCAVPEEKTSLRLFLFNVEDTKLYSQFIQDFESIFPAIAVQLETENTQREYKGKLKAKLETKQKPAIFSLVDFCGMDEYSDYLFDVSQESYMKDVYDSSIDPVRQGSSVLAVPLRLDGYGLIYNKKILRQAGYSEEDMNGLRSFEDLKQVFLDLESKKKRLGIEEVLSYSVGSSAWWTAAYHTSNIPFAMQDDFLEFQRRLSEGTVSLTEDFLFQRFTETLDLFFAHSYKNLLETPYEKLLSDFALEKTAFLQQGSWVEKQLREISPWLELAFVPIPIRGASPEKNSSLAVHSTQFWAINKQLSKEELSAAKQFLSYLFTSSRGKRFLSEENRYIPAFSTVSAQDDAQLAQSLLRFVDEKRTLPWAWISFPDDYVRLDVSAAIARYYLKEFTQKEFLEYLDAQWSRRVSAGACERTGAF